MPSKRHKRIRLLLDEGLSPKEAYPNTNNYHNVVHINHDLKMGGSDDRAVYKFANKDKRVPIVFNTKDFKALIEKNTSSVISLSTNLSEKQADLKICSALDKLTSSKLKGYLISISNQGVVVKKVK